MHIGKQWGQVYVRAIYNGAVVAVLQGDQEVFLPAAAVERIAAAMRRKVKRTRKPASARTAQRVG